MKGGRFARERSAFRVRDRSTRIDNNAGVSVAREIYRPRTRVRRGRAVGRDEITFRGELQRAKGF